MLLLRTLRAPYLGALGQLIAGAAGARPDHPIAVVAIALHQTAGRTSSAMASSVLGICTASAFAVFRWMTSSNFVGYRTGISTGFLPFRILRGHRKCVASDRQRNSASRQLGSTAPAVRSGQFSSQGPMNAVPNLPSQKMPWRFDDHSDAGANAPGY